MNQPDFLTLEEAAKGLNKSVQTVRRMIKRGEISAKQVKTPQGFQYLIASKEIFSYSTIQKPLSSTQDKILTGRNDLEQLLENDFYTLDRNVNPEPGATRLRKIIDLQYKEKMTLIRILERLQADLSKEQEPHSFLERICRRLFG